MMPDNHIRDERPEREMGEQDDPTLTTRVSRPGGTAEEAKPAETTPLQRPRQLLAESCSRSGGESRKNETGPSGLRSTLVARTTWTGARRFSVLGTAVVLVRLRVSRLVLHLRRGKAGSGPADEAQFRETGERSATGGPSGIHNPAPQCRPRRRRSE